MKDLVLNVRDKATDRIINVIGKEGMNQEEADRKYNTVSMHINPRCEYLSIDPKP